MKTLIPTLETSSLRREIDRLLDRSWDGGEDFPKLGDWNPMDLSETTETLVAKIEVPSIEPADIQVNLQNGVLTVKGEKKKETEEKDERPLRRERSYGAFARSLKLPISVDPSKVTATFNKGVLTIVMSKSPEANGTSIPIMVT